MKKNLVASLLLWGVALAASAQYVWTDEKGVKQYSDRPPPPDVPASRIIKAPGKALAAPPAAAPAAGEGAAAKAAAPTLADRNAEFNKRRAEQAEKEKKAAAEVQEQAEQREACTRAREAYRTLASGERISRTDENGEKVFMEDAQRAREIAELNKMLAQCPR